MNPNELHFNDPLFYEHVYAGSLPKTNKDSYNAGLTGLQTAVSVTVDHDHHRRRRGYYANFFSKQSTLRREDFIQEKVDKLMQRLHEAYHRRETITAITAFGALTTDVISHYAYGESFGELDVPGMPSPMTRDIKSMSTFLDLNHKMESLSIVALQKSDSKASSAAQKTIFEALTDPKIPPEEKTLLRLKEESMLIIGAGLDTTSRFLTCALCYLVTFPHVMAKLRTELKTLENNPPTLSKLEALPYLVRTPHPHALAPLIF
jgi:cytochrome P450